MRLCSPECVCQTAPAKSGLRSSTTQKTISHLAGGCFLTCDATLTLQCHRFFASILTVSATWRKPCGVPHSSPAQRPPAATGSAQWSVCHYTCSALREAPSRPAGRQRRRQIGRAVGSSDQDEGEAEKGLAGGRRR